MLKTVEAGVLDIAYLESGPADGPPVVLLRGFPYDVHAYRDVSARLSAKESARSCRTCAGTARPGSAARGPLLVSALVQRRQRTGVRQPDFVDVIIHSYRHRFGGVPRDPAYDAFEARLAEQPAISVPTVVLLGADDGVDPPPKRDAQRSQFTGPYQSRVVPGVGHNLPQEAPAELVAAVSSLIRPSRG